MSLKEFEKSYMCLQIKYEFILYLSNHNGTTVLYLKYVKITLNIYIFVFFIFSFCKNHAMGSIMLKVKSLRVFIGPKQSPIQIFCLKVFGFERQTCITQSSCLFLSLAATVIFIQLEERRITLEKQSNEEVLGRSGQVAIVQSWSNAKDFLKCSFWHILSCDTDGCTKLSPSKIFLFFIWSCDLFM